MRYFLDSEFIDDGRTIELLSIGLVSEDGREYYAVVRDASWALASGWVSMNVLPKLDLSIAKPRAQIRHEILKFLGVAPVDPYTGRKLRPEIWAYFGSYDWVAFCQLFGPMVSLPDDLPRYVRDVKQLCDDLGDPALPQQAKGLHHALEDAKWTRKAWEFLNALKGRPTS